MAKVILTDNFNRDYIEDRLYADNLTEEEAEQQAKQYNEKHGPGWDWYAKKVADDHKLWGGITEYM